jgi:hypothetical protein
MAGLSDYLAQAVLNFMTGTSPMPALASRYLALFTAAPTADAGTGGTEVSTSSTGYARVQVAGALAAAAASAGCFRSERQVHAQTNGRHWAHLRLEDVEDLMCMATMASLRNSRRLAEALTLR